MDRRSWIQFVAILLLAIVSWTCKNSTGLDQDRNPAKALVVLQLETDFRNDSVRVEFDSQPLFAGRVTTNFSIAIAWSSDVLTVPAGVHTVKVSVFANDIVGQVSPDLQDTMTVTANYNRQARQLEFRTYDHFILRR